jgi:hypothetical protein
MAPGFVAASLSLVALVMAWRALPEPERHIPPKERKLFDYTALRHALTLPTVPTILFLQVIATFCFANFEATLALLTKERWDYDIRENGFIFTYVGFWLMLCQGVIVRRLMPRLGEVRMTVIGSLILGIGLIGIAATDLGALVILPVATLGFSLLSPSLASLLSLRTPADMQGEILGLGQAGLALARILGPAIGLALFALTPETPYWISGAIMALALLASLSLLRSAPGEPI